MPDMIDQAATPSQPPSATDPQIYVGVDGIEVQFPEGFWTRPELALVCRGRPRREWIIDQVALAIAAQLRRALAAAAAERTTGLVGPDGRPV